MIEITLIIVSAVTVAVEPVRKEHAVVQSTALIAVGAAETAIVGSTLGDLEGRRVGCRVGAILGAVTGAVVVPATEGVWGGLEVAFTEGTAVGLMLGTGLLLGGAEVGGGMGVSGPIRKRL